MRSHLAFILASILVGSSAWAAQPPRTEGKNNAGANGAANLQSPKTFKVSAQLNFKEEYPSMVKLNGERFKGRPWVEATDDSIRFYDKQGSLRNQIRGAFVSRRQEFDSRGGARKLIHLFKDNRGALIEDRAFLDQQGHSTATWTIMDAEGEVRGIIRDTKGQGFLKSSPNGKLFLMSRWIGEGIGSEGSIKLFDDSGNDIGDRKLFDWPGNERIDFSDDGNYALYSQQGNGRGGIALVDSSGNVLGKHEEDDWNPIGPGDIGPGDTEPRPLIRFGTTARRLLLAAAKKNSTTLECFGFDLARVWSIEYSGSLSMEINEDASRVFLLSTGRESSHISILDGATGKTIHSAPVELYRAPGVPGKPYYYAEKPWDRFKTFRSGDLVVLVYSDARTKDKRRVSGFNAFDFDGNMIGSASLDNPTRFWVDEQGGIFAGQGKGIKKWHVEKLD